MTIPILLRITRLLVGRRASGFVQVAKRLLIPRVRLEFRHVPHLEAPEKTYPPLITFLTERM